MQRWRKPESTYIQGICIECKQNKQKPRGLTKKGRRYDYLCSGCKYKTFKSGPRSKYERRTAYGYKRHKKDSCEHCGFTAIHKCQLDVDHIDGDHSNNKLDNLQTLCANCHRLKTFTQRWGPCDQA